MKVLVVAGARPNFMKVAPILRALEKQGADGVFVHTGQHYDATMSDSFPRDLSMPAPAWHLGVGSGTHARQTARIMESFEPVIERERPDWVVVVGDVNSTLACALVASKMANGVRIAHVEASLRSRDWTMPEEVNRVLTDRLSPDPVGYVEMLALEDCAAAVITASGGVQEETTVLGVPCLTVRETTERPVTVTEGTLVPWPATEQGIGSALEQALNTGRVEVGAKGPEGWDGKAGVRIADALAMRMAS